MLSLHKQQYDRLMFLLKPEIHDPVLWVYERTVRANLHEAGDYSCPHKNPSKMYLKRIKHQFNRKYS